MLLSIAGLVLLVYGIVQGGDIGSWIHPAVLGPIAGGLAILAAFGWYETRIAHPSLDVRLFRDHRLSASVGAIALVFFGMGGVFFFTSFYLQNVRGYTPLAAGLLTVPFAAGQLLFSPRSAGLVRRYGAKAVGATGLSVMALALGRVRHARHRDPDLAARRDLRGPGRGDRRRHAGRHRGRHGRPAARAGRRGSALTNIARQVAVALSVAVLGSILAEVLPRLAQPGAGSPARRRAVTLLPSRSPPPRRSPSSWARPGGRCWSRRTTRSSTPCTPPRSSPR